MLRLYDLLVYPLRDGYVKNIWRSMGFSVAVVDSGGW
ncbi:hypothetical protein POPTR_006G122650v4 [Populus trichocarpa]|uniref:Uncharacterized protein n=1 Tax=Populus trichocarpa TaxID=3694 RepID=A0ACC0STT2_POPTR|nr:hypothetical protein BDE02_06G109500 [Populus trichocarpa]KAI9392670.1 hypothetical protein POPTR_006G122650v4 [Populus trichocarpa]